jgi:hypothetical protein
MRKKIKLSEMDKVMAQGDPLPINIDRSGVVWVAKHLPIARVAMSKTGTLGFRTLCGQFVGEAFTVEHAVEQILGGIHSNQCKSH